jgi:BlaI family penicillinase repressor
MKPLKIRISAAEWEVMKLVWDRAPRTAQEMVDELGAAQDWSPTTIRTLIGRLKRKGALKFRQSGKKYLYSPAIDREHCVSSESRSFMERVFGGVPAGMLVHLIRETKLSRDEIRELRALLDEKEE